MKASLFLYSISAALDLRSQRKILAVVNKYTFRSSLSLEDELQYSQTKSAVLYKTEPSNITTRIELELIPITNKIVILMVLFNNMSSNDHYGT